jgi:hypothetical protein
VIGPGARQRVTHVRPRALLALPFCFYSPLPLLHRLGEGRIWLYDNFLTGGLPTELGRATENRYIFTYENRLDGTICTELGQLAELITLYTLAFGYACTQLPLFQPLFRSSALTSLSTPTLPYARPCRNIGDNLLAGTIPTELGRLHVARHLNLAPNEITGTVPTELGRMPSLEYMCAQRGPLLPSTMAQHSTHHTNRYSHGCTPTLRRALAATPPAQRARRHVCQLDAAERTGSCYGPHWLVRAPRSVCCVQPRVLQRSPLDSSHPTRCPRIAFCARAGSSSGLGCAARFSTPTLSQSRLAAASRRRPSHHFCLRRRPRHRARRRPLPRHPARPQRRSTSAAQGVRRSSSTLRLTATTQDVTCGWSLHATGSR